MPGPGLEVSATFGRNRDGIDVIDTAPPDVLPPEQAPDVDELVGTSGRLRPAFFSNFDNRLVLGAPWWQTDWAAGPARLARWFRYKVPQRRDDGTLDPFALPPIADTMPPALIQKLGPAHAPFHAPSLDLTVHFLEDTDAEWLLVSVHARRARAGYATASAEIWDDRRRLLAFATQTMMLRSVPEDGIPMRP
jgi:acyl-CoA thioesterase